MGESDSEDSWWESIARYPDEIFEAGLRYDAEQQAHFWNLFTTGKEFAKNIFEEVLSCVKNLYGSAVSESVGHVVRYDISWESTWSYMGFILQLHEEHPWALRSRINILGTVNVDLCDILENVPYDSAPLVALWNPELEDNENLEKVMANVENVHGLVISSDFSLLVKAVRCEYPTLLEALIAILDGRKYGDFSQWRLSRHPDDVTSPHKQIDWSSVLTGLPQNDK
jgi:hypothetical protein